MGKKVLVTGAAGFIGSNLSEKLVEAGNTVVGVDNLSQGNPKNIEELRQNPSFSFQEIDVRNLENMSQAAKDVDSIVHLAAFKIPRYGNAFDTLQINSQGTENCLKIAAEKGLKMVFASTSDVYGKNPNLPFSEESDLLMGPSTVKRWSYAVSKIFDEHLCLAYKEKFEVPVSILRFFGGYGKNQNLSWWGGPQSVFIEKVFKGEKLPIHGDGKQTRTFIYIDDLVDGIVKSLEAEKANGEVFNLGSEEEVCILDLAKLIHELCQTGKELETELIPYETFGKYEDVRRRVPDISKAKKLLGFNPQYTLRAGLEKTIAWQKEFYA